jgi:hypothetical protein
MRFPAVTVLSVLSAVEAFALRSVVKALPINGSNVYMLYNRKFAEETFSS